MSYNDFKIFWNDLTPDCQKRLEKFLGDNGNYDVFPIATITKECVENDCN